MWRRNYTKNKSYLRVSGPGGSRARQWMTQEGVLLSEQYGPALCDFVPEVSYQALGGHGQLAGSVYSLPSLYWGHLSWRVETILLLCFLFSGNLAVTCSMTMCLHTGLVHHRPAGHLWSWPGNRGNPQWMLLENAEMGGKCQKMSIGNIPSMKLN